MFFFVISEFNDHYWPTKVLEIGYLTELLRKKNDFELFTAKFCLLILPFSIFLIYLLTMLEN